MLQLGLGWRVGIYALLIGLVTGYVKGCTDEKVRSASFEGAVAAIGEQQEKMARTIGAANKKRKGDSDAENLKLRTDYNLLSVKLRASRARSSIVPPAAPGASRPAVAAFDRAELERALRDFEAEVTGLVEEGDRARIDLDTVKRWASDSAGLNPSAR